MSASSDKKDLRFHLHHLESALARRRQLDVDIKAFSARVRELCNKTGEPLPPALQRNPTGRAGGGLSDSIRALFAPGDPLTAAEVHDSLVASGTLDVKKYRNSQSVIHNTLRRMVKQCELSIARTVPKTAYRKAG